GQRIGPDVAERLGSLLPSFRRKIPWLPGSPANSQPLTQLLPPILRLPLPRPHESHNPRHHRTPNQHHDAPSLSHVNTISGTPPTENLSDPIFLTNPFPVSTILPVSS